MDKKLQISENYDLNRKIATQERERGEREKKRDYNAYHKEKIYGLMNLGEDLENNGTIFYAGKRLDRQECLRD